MTWRLAPLFFPAFNLVLRIPTELPKLRGVLCLQIYGDKEKRTATLLEASKNSGFHTDHSLCSFVPNPELSDYNQEFCKVLRCLTQELLARFAHPTIGFKNALRE